MTTPYRETTMLDENDIEKRIKKLENGHLAEESFNKTMRTIARAICLALLATLGTAYGCNRENARAEVEKAHFTCIEKTPVVK